MSLFAQSIPAPGSEGMLSATRSMPIGGVYVYAAADENDLRSPLQDPTITALAAKHGRTPAQVIVRWHIEHGLCAIPKSVRAERIAENFDVFNFPLTSQDISASDALDTGVRGGPDPEIVDTTLYSFAVDNT